MSQKEIEGEKHKKEMKNEEIIDLIEGYAFPITTPFGKVLSLSADLLTTGRPLRNIEENIQKFIRPFAQYSYRRVALGEKARNYARKSVAELLHLSNETYEIVFLHPNAEMDPFRRIAAIFLESLTKEKPGSKIQVYLQTNQSYVKVMPWLQYPERIKVVTLESDNTGSLGASTIVKAVLKNAAKARFNVIQLQALSSKTKQKLDLQAFQAQIEALRIEYPNLSFACVIDATPLISGSGYSNKEIDDALNFFDFSIIQTGRLLGGAQGASILLCKKAKLTKLQVKLSSADLSEEVEPTSILRASHLLEFYYSQGLPQRIESSQNTQLFFDEVQKVNQRLRETSVLNKIELGGIKVAAPAGRYSIMILNEGSQDFLEEEFKGYPVILAKHLAQIMNDLFGIQVKASNMLNSKQYNFRFSDISPSAITKYGLTPETGNVELNASTIELDIHFLLTQDEIMYIISALEQIALGSGKLIKYYNKKLLKPKMFIPQQVNVSLAACSSFPYVETDISNREEQYTKQLYESSRILKQPANYFTISENWSEEKSTVFPLNALADSFPLKERKTNVTNVDNDVDSDDSAPSLVLPNIPKKVVVVNSKAVQEARNLILRIQTQGPDTPKNNLIRKPKEVSVRKESIQLLDEGQAQMSQEYLEQLREQIKRELRGELRQEVELEIKEKEEKEASERAAAKKKDAKSAMNEQFQLKEKRSRNLKSIFLFYSTLPDFLEEKPQLPEKDQQNQKTPIPFFLKKLGQQENTHKLGLNKFFKFCDDFQLISEQLDLKTLYKLFTQVCPHNDVSNAKSSKSTSSSQQLQSILKNPQILSSPSSFADISSSVTKKTNSKTLNSSDISENNKISLAYPGELQFNQFSLVIDKMAQVFFAKNDNLFTQFDKIDAFHKHLGLDDKKNYRHRLKAEGLVSFSFLFHDKYQLFTSLPAHIRNSSDVQEIIQKPNVDSNKKPKFISSSQNDLEQPKQAKNEQLSQYSWQYQEQYPSNSSFSSYQSSLFQREAQLVKNTNRKFEEPIGDTNIYVSQLNPQNITNSSKITKNQSLNLLPSLSSIYNTPHSGMMKEVELSSKDQNALNHKLLNNDPTISQQDILQENSQTQQTKKLSQQRVQSQPPLEASKYLPNDIYKNQQQLFASPFKAKNTFKTDFITPNNNSTNNNKSILNTSNSHAGHSFSSIQPSQFQQLNSPKLSSQDIANFPGIPQADIRKQQVLSRAKQLSILGKEKERDQLRLHTSEGDSPTSGNQIKNKMDTSILLAKQNQAIHSPAIYSNLQKK